MRALLASVLSSLSLVACGGGGAPAPTTPEPAHHEGEHHEGEAHEHPPMPAELTAFHDVLAPLWHADAGPDRQARTCDAVDQLDQLAGDLAATPRPEGTEEAAWQVGVEELQDAIFALRSDCGSGEDFDARFGAVHDAFHGLMGQLPHE